MNREDFGRHYDAQYPRVFRYLLWRLRDRDAAEELAAEVFAIALTAFQKGTEPKQAGGWLVGIADHLATRSWRKQQTEEVITDSCLATAEDPEERVLTRLESAMIWRCVDALSPEHRQVLLLRVVAGLSARDVGGLMGKTDDAVRSLQLHALQALQGFWKEEETCAKPRNRA